MGLEATCVCRWSGGSGEVKATLETRELILRGGLRRTLALVALNDVHIQDGDLCFRVESEDIALALGADRAARWAKKIAAPPPSLAHKLGIGPLSKVLVIGSIDDGGLLEVLDGRCAVGASKANLSLAVVRAAGELARALAGHEALPPGSPIWIVHGKGPRANFGEGPVRRIMREAGYRDSKVSAVSDTLCATRYARR